MDDNLTYQSAIYKFDADVGDYTFIFRDITITVRVNVNGTVVSQEVNEGAKVVSDEMLSDQDDS